MLSPGKYHLSIPKSPQRNLAYRQDVYRQSVGSHSLQRGLIEACRNDILFYINTFVWQYDPTKIGDEPKTAPFITWDFQEEAVRAILDCIQCHCNQEDGVHQHDLVIEKSREMGASWLCLLIIEWMWHFHPWNKLHCISRSAPLVDSNSSDSLFWKLDHVHRHMPKWLMPNGWKLRNNRSNMLFENPENHSQISGEATTEKAGIGGRATVMFIDEFSQIREDKEVLHRTSDTTGCRIFNGTHKGTTTAFFELTKRPDMKKLVMHWSQHPDKKGGLYRYFSEGNRIEVLDRNFRYHPTFQFVRAELPSGGPFPGLRSPWYDNEVIRKKSQQAAAKDLDIDAGGTQRNVFDPLQIRNLKALYAIEPLWRGDLEYDRDTGKPLRLVQRDDGPILLWTIPRPDGSIVPGMYVAGTDLSTGLGATNSCFSIANGRTGEKVLELATPNMRPELFAPLCVAICRMFIDDYGTPAKLAWEHNGPGLMFAKTVVEELGYTNVFYRDSANISDGGKKSAIPGWVSNIQNKRILIEDYRNALYNRRFLNRSDISLEECLSFVYDDNGQPIHTGELNSEDPTGARNNHGDRVIPDALCWKMCGDVGRTAQQEAKEEILVGSLAWRIQLHHNQLRREEDVWV